MSRSLIHQEIILFFPMYLVKQISLISRRMTVFFFNIPPIQLEVDNIHDAFYEPFASGVSAAERNFIVT
jgi:hypothetical protein